MTRKLAAVAPAGSNRAARRHRARTATHRPAVRPRQFQHDTLTAVDLFCVDEQTEILTGTGWKRYDKLTTGDITLTIRPDGSAAEWQPVTAVNVFPAQRRKMQSIEGRGLSALTTDNHRWLVRQRTKTYLGGGRRASRYAPGPYRFEFRRSDELTSENTVPMAAQVANLPAEPTVPDALVELVAWYWTEGNDRASGRVHIVQDHVVNPRHVDAIRVSLVALFGPERAKRKRPGGPQWAENRWGNQTTFGLNREAASALQAAAPGKVLSTDWLRTLTQSQLDLLIQRSLDADGHERTRPSGRAERVVSQGNEARAAAFQAACLIAGHAASMKPYQTTYRHGDTVREARSWAVTVGMRPFVKPIRQKRVEWINHDGIVWCPTTPNGTWLARRNGTCYFTGNSGYGGLTQGIEMAGFTAIVAANHDEYKIGVHEANHPHVKHLIADLVDRESSAYSDVRDLPAADLLVAGVACTNHTLANSMRAYEQGLTLFDLEDPDFAARVTRSERDRATANCVLAYAERHHPRMILVECTTELTSWGPAIPGKKKIGDGSTYRWWLKQFELLGYKYKVLYLNSMFFGVGQSRDRYYCVFWDRKLPAPDLEHRPLSWCGSCDDVVEAVWTWRTGVPPTGSVRYGKQYNYRCPRCRREVVPPMTPSLDVLDLSNLGTRIGDRKTPLAAATMARAERCRQRFAEFPAILMPAKAVHGTERHPWQPMATQTSQQETALLSTGAVMVAAGNAYERPGSDCRSRSLGQPLWTQTGTNAVGLVTPPVALTGQVFAAHRHNGDGQHIGRPMDTVTATHEKAVLLAAGMVPFHKGTSPRGVDEPGPTQTGSETLGLLSVRVLPNRINGTSRGAGEPTETIVGNAGSGGLSVLSSGIVPFRKNTVPTTHGEPMPTQTAGQIPGLLTAAGTIKNNGGVDEAGYRANPVSDPLGTLVASGAHQSALFSGWMKQNGANPDATAPHPMSDPLGTLTARDTTALVMAEWQAMLAQIPLDDCYFRMLAPHEVGRGCGFDTTYPGRPGTFKVWGSARDQVDGFGNAVSPQVGRWIGERLRAALHGSGVGPL